MKTRTQSLLLALAVLAALAAVAFAPSAGAQSGGLRITTSSAEGEAESGTGNGAIAWSSTRWAGATWYGPGFYGHRTACGQTLRRGTIGVAHRNLPCGTAVKFIYHGHAVVAPVIDRGPYANGVSWDLTNGARERLGFEGSGKIRYAVEASFARR